MPSQIGMSGLTDPSPVEKSPPTIFLPLRIPTHLLCPGGQVGLRDGAAVPPNPRERLMAQATDI